MKAEFFDSASRAIPTVILTAETPEEAIIMNLLCSGKLTFSCEKASTPTQEQGTAEKPGVVKMGFWPTQDDLTVKTSVNPPNTGLTTPRRRGRRDAP